MLPNSLKRISLWGWTAVLLAALVVPALPVQAAASAAFDGASLRHHVGGWLDDAPAGERAAAEARAAQITRDRAAAIPPRPPVDPIQQQQTTAEWTVMVFIAGDNNLEEAALYDINEMEAVGSSPDVNVVVEVDRSADYSDMDGDWTDTRRYYIQQDQDQERITSPILQELGETNSGDSTVVGDFVTWAITTYPAQKYMLVLWDHGGAWISHLSDEETGDDQSLPELVAVLDRVKQETGIDKFEVIGFDMCLMGQLEVFSALEPYAHYAIGSEENEPGPGWFYLFLNELVKNPGMNGAELGPHITKYYMDFFNEWGYADLYGLSAVDLSQTGTVTAALDQFSTVVQASPEASLSAIADARNNTISYGGFDDPQYYDIWSSVDLYRFAELLNQISTTPEVQQAAQGIMSAVDSYVIASEANDALEGSNGVSIYFPRTYKAYKFGAFNERYPVEVPGVMASWINFLSVFHGTATSTVSEAPKVDVVSVFPETASIYQPAVVTLDVSGRDILEVNFAVAQVISETERIVYDYDYLISRTTTATGADIIDWSNGVTSRTFTWEAEIPVITDGTNSTYALLIPSRDNPNIAIVSGQYTPVSGGDPMDAQLVFDLNTRQAVAVWGINETASGALQPSELTVQAGDLFRPVWLTLDANNELSGSGVSDVALVLGGETPISFEKVPAPSGTYSISFVALNVAGATTLDEAVIQVNNDNLDPSQRGYTDLTYGVNFRYPAHWLRPRFLPDGKRLYTGEETGDLATTTAMTLYPYTDVASAEETANAIKASWNELENLQITGEREVEINGLPAYVIDYTYSIGSLNRVGAVIAIYVPSQNVGYGFDIDAPADHPESAQQALQILVESINFFEPQQAAGESGWQTVTMADGLVSFPVPANWTPETSDNWTMYGPVDDPSVFVGLAAAPTMGMTNEELAQYWLEQLQSRPGFTVLASEPYYVGNQEWHLVVFTYEGAVKMAGAFFVTSDGTNDYAFWLEAPDASFDQLYADVFSVTVGGFTFNG